MPTYFPAQNNFTRKRPESLEFRDEGIDLLMDIIEKLTEGRSREELKADKNIVIDGDEGSLYDLIYDLMGRDGSEGEAIHNPLYTYQPASEKISDFDQKLTLRGGEVDGVMSLINEPHVQGYSIDRLKTWLQSNVGIRKTKIHTDHRSLLGV